MEPQISQISQKNKRDPLSYDIIGVAMDKYYEPDFICFDTHVVEIKAESNMTAVDEAQIINILKASRLQTGLLINFGESSLKYKRFIYT